LTVSFIKSTKNVEYIVYNEQTFKITDISQNLASNLKLEELFYEKKLNLLAILPEISDFYCHPNTT